MSKFITKLISAIFTFWGVVMILRGDVTNGLLAMIVGELTDMPKNN